MNRVTHGDLNKVCLDNDSYYISSGPAATLMRCLCRYIDPSFSSSARKYFKGRAMASAGHVNYSLLKDATCIVTGGASSLGKAIASKLVSYGAYVTIADISEGQGQSVDASLSANGGHASFALCDVTDWTSCVNAFRHAISFGPSKTLDIAVLFAGVPGESQNLVDIVLKEDLPKLTQVDVPRPSHSAVTSTSSECTLLVGSPCTIFGCQDPQACSVRSRLSWFCR